MNREETSRTGLTLVVPCFNEAARLVPQAFLEFVASHPAARLLFVDDGSTDGTTGILERLQAAAPEAIGLVRLPSRCGKAEAVRAGINDALADRPELVGFWDADLSTPLGAVDDFLALAAKRPEMELILGSRVMLMGKDIRRQAWRHYLGRVFATCVSLTLELPVYDTQCGAKVFRVNDDVASLFDRPFRSRWIFDVEVLARYLALPPGPGPPPRRLRIYELAVPVWHHTPGSKLRAWDFLRAVLELWAVRRDRTTAARRGSAGAE